MERLQALAEASSSQPRYTPPQPTPPPPSIAPAAGRKRRPITFSDEDRRIVVRSIADMAKTDREGSSFGALWKNLAQQYPRHSAHAWRSCWKEINAAEQAAGNGKKLKAPFSPEDEEALIEFLAAGGPKPNLSWKDFAVQHPERRVEAWQMYSYRNRDRLIERIRQRRLELGSQAGEDDGYSDDVGAVRPRSKPRRSGVHFNEADRRVLEDALEAIPNPRDARALTRLWSQLEAEHPERSAQSWKKCYLKFRDEIGEGASRTSPRRPGRYGAAYTEAEEDALIVFLAGKRDPDASWGDFTNANPGRTKEAWRQHWYGNRERLLKRAQVLGLEVTEEGSIFSESFRVGRSSRLASAAAKGRAASQQQQSKTKGARKSGLSDGDEQWTTDEEEDDEGAIDDDEDEVAPAIAPISPLGVAIPGAGSNAPALPTVHTPKSLVLGPGQPYVFTMPRYPGPMLPSVPMATGTGGVPSLLTNYSRPLQTFPANTALNLNSSGSSPRSAVKRNLAEMTSAGAPFITIGHDDAMQPPASPGYYHSPYGQHQLGSGSKFSSATNSPASTVASMWSGVEADTREPPLKRKRKSVIDGASAIPGSPLAGVSTSSQDDDDDNDEDSLGWHTSKRTTRSASRNMSQVPTTSRLPSPPPSVASPSSDQDTRMYELAEVAAQALAEVNSSKAPSPAPSEPVTDRPPSTPAAGASLFTADDRVKAATFIAAAGVHPSPGILLRFAEDNPEHTLPGWLNLIETTRVQATAQAQALARVDVSHKPRTH